MGLYIHLSVNFRGITEEAWETAWHESLDILKKFPLPLFRYDVEAKKGKERHVYSRNLVFEHELKAALKVLIEKHPNLYEGKSVDAYLRGIYKYSFDAGWGLSAEGWQKLDQIKDVTLLKSLFALATVDNHEITFWRWRKHIFEHVELFGGTNFSNDK